MIDEDAILDSVRYLRYVRPIDPDEITTYVPDNPHPAVVRQTIRDHSVELGLYERDDGTFEPVGDDPVDSTFDGVDRFPESWSRLLEDLLVDHYGPGWHDGESGDRLRYRIDRMKTEYFAGEAVEYDLETAFAYAIYHLPDYYAAIQYVLAELTGDGLLPRKLSILDVGAGAGGPALGIHDFMPTRRLVAYDAVEPSPAADVLSHFLDRTGQNFHASIHRERAEEFTPKDTYDLLCFNNVIAELEDPVALVDRYIDSLADDGTLLVLSPAEKRTATRLRSVEREILDRRPDLTVFAPTVRLWPDEKPQDRGWTFTRKRPLELPSFQVRLDRGTGSNGHVRADAGDETYCNVDIQFAYLLARTDGRRAIEFEPDHRRVAKMADSDRHVTERLDYVGIKLSPNIGEGNPLYKVGDGSEGVDHYAVLTRQSALNDAVLDAPYGALLRFENVLVLWNDDEDAYNLVIDDQSVVDRLA